MATRSTRKVAGAAAVAVLAVGGVALAAGVQAQSGGTATVVVQPGQSVQSAIDAAAPGTTIVLRAGTYPGDLTITKTVSLRGQGTVVIQPAATFSHNVCNDDPHAVGPDGSVVVTGICIGQILPDETVVKTVADVSLANLQVRGFGAAGMFAAGTTGLRVQNVEFDHNGDYGVIADLSDHLTFQGNRIHDNGNGGLHLGSDAVITATANQSYRNNAEGILLADSTGAHVDANQLSGNCVGLVAVDTGVPGPTSDLHISGNIVQGNDRYCAGDAGPGGRPAEGGLGMALAGTARATVSGNRITDNVLAGLPFGAQPPVVRGGLALIDSTPFGGAAPTDNRISGNTIRGNAPLDVVTDGSGSGNRFDGNSCGAASIEGVCR